MTERPHVIVGFSVNCPFCAARVEGEVVYHKNREAHTNYVVAATCTCGDFHATCTLGTHQVQALEQLGSDLVDVDRETGLENDGW